jgi:catechol 2,3-dioxygenase-like lactoylglutathione lyase family enzyme
MTVRGLDHIAITVADVERTLEFYSRVLGAVLQYEDFWRSGKMPVAILQVGESRISVHDAAKPASPHAAVPCPGSVDFCFAWEGGIAAAEEHLIGLGIDVIEGPVPRPAADGSRAESVYFRDPDDNLVELLSKVP